MGNWYLYLYLFLEVEIQHRLSSIMDHQQQMQSQEYQEAEETEGIWHQGRTDTEPKIGPMLNTSLSLGILIM